MKLFITTILALTLISAQLNAHTIDTTVIKVEELVRVYDGDTITVTIAELPPLFGEELGIRVRGVDTPEIRGQCEDEKVRAKQARDYAEQLLVNAHVVLLKNLERGKYFRLVADVYYDGKNLSDTLIEEGHGRPYAGGSRVGWCD